jgi:hypothetical protein
LGEEHASLGELILLLVYLGAPAFVLVIAGQLWFIRRLLDGPLGGRRSVACSAATLVLAIPLSLVAWQLLPAGIGERYVQIFNFLFLPALIGGAAASAVTSSVVLILGSRAA